MQSAEAGMLLSHSRNQKEVNIARVESAKRKMGDGKGEGGWEGR